MQLNDDDAEVIGKALVEALGLKPNKHGLYYTCGKKHGVPLAGEFNKTPAGIARTCLHILTTEKEKLEG